MASKTKSMSSYFFGCVILTFSLALSILQSTARADVTLNLTDHAKSEYVVLTPEKPTPPEDFAASELIKYIKIISGATLPRQERGGTLPDKAIIICEKERLAAWSNIWEKPVTQGDAYEIVTKGNRIFLVGNRGRSTLYAVYDFLDRLGCRFLAPNFSFYQNSAEYIPRKNPLSITLPPAIYEKAAFRSRSLDIAEGRSDTAEKLIQLADYMAKTRYNALQIPSSIGRSKWDNWRAQVLPELQRRDLNIEVGGHGYNNFLNSGMEGGKLFQLHPEWFGMNAKGVRESDQIRDSVGRQRIFCISNPDARKYMIANVIKYIKAHPEITIFDCWPPDWGFWCECDKCKALGNPSDQQGLLLNQMYDEFAAQLPSPPRLECIVYANFLETPKHVKYNKNLMLDFSSGNQNFEFLINDPRCAGNAEYVSYLKAWIKAYEGEIGISTYYFRYVFKALPMVIPHFIQKELQYYYALPARGSIQAIAGAGFLDSL